MRYISSKSTGKNDIYMTSYEDGINVLSLLDGAGASCEVLKRLQIKVKKVFAVEKNDKSRKVAKHNHGNMIEYLPHDVTSIDCGHIRKLIREKGPIPLILGCWPCDLQCGANAQSSKMVSEYRREVSQYNPRLFDPIRAQVFRVCSFVKLVMLEEYP